MIENIEVDGVITPVSELTQQQQSMVKVLERLAAEEQELQFSMAKVHALASAIRAELVKDVQGSNAPEAA